MKPASYKREQIYRIIDANFNRAKEGLRVCEDVCRFFYNKRSLTKKYKDLRHDLTAAVLKLRLARLINARDIEGDVGRGSSISEQRRNNIDDIFMANSQRVKESVRVLEEMAKLLNRAMAGELKRIRYRGYALEKQVMGRS